MRRIVFYRQSSGACPVEKFLDSLAAKEARKIIWTLQLVRTLPRPPAQYFKKLVGTELWEIRSEIGGNAFRLLGFFDGDTVIVLTSGFAKKTRKTPKQEIETAERRMKEYYTRKQ